MKSITFKIALTAIYTSLATITFTIESLFPPLILPGARLGLSNVFILLSLISLGAQYGYIALVVKIALGSLFSGNVSSIMYSLPAGIISLSVEYLILKFIPNISVVSTSVSGAIINTTTQNVVFCLIGKTAEYLCYLPYLSLIAVLSGIVVGFTVYLIVKKLPSSPPNGGERINNN